MKGVKLLFTALLCLATSGAWAQYTYDVRQTAKCHGEWSSGNIPFTIENTADASSYSYTYILYDDETGLKYFIDAPESEAWGCYVGLDGNYKETSKTPATSVSIPSTITYTIKSQNSSSYVTQTRHVTVIVNEGFTTVNNGHIPDSDETKGNGYVIYKGDQSDGSDLDDRSRCYNPNLEEVTFVPATDGNYYLQWIGDRAFQGCTQLKSAMIPPSVTRMGESVFAMCFRMKTCEFATKSTTVDGAAQEATELKKVPDNCFYQCNALESLEIPYGVTSIGDYALQDNWSLKSITFPNTLTSFGAHNLCRAISLKSFYMPSSVTFIDAAFMHGCYNMRDVYLLGNAADLNDQASSSKGNTRTFEEETGNNTCPECPAVNNCTFHVTYAAHEGYIASSSTWHRVFGGGNGVFGKEGSADEYNSKVKTLQHNCIVWPEGSNDERYVRDFGPYKWVSVIFYNSISMSDFKTQFGNDALAATYTDCYKDSKDSKVYHLGFTTISSNGTVPAKTPLMIYIGSKTVKGYQMNTESSETDAWREFYTHRYNVEQSVRIGSRTSTTYASGESVIMVGLPVPIPMHENEFYFKWVDAQDDNDPTNADTHYGRIRRCTTAGDSYKGRFSCFWQIKKDGVRVQDAQLGSAKGFVPMDDANSPTGINNVNAGKPTSFDVNIYDINGRLVGTSRASLPKGLYIQGGKKFIKK